MEQIYTCSDPNCTEELPQRAESVRADKVLPGVRVPNQELSLGWEPSVDLHHLVILGLVEDVAVSHYNSLRIFSLIHNYFEPKKLTL